ncbi:MAG: BrxA/BrxB family bacilliredoxin [Melioribacteraceae bacterium]|nr:BrxA/BrxB family bacilliredoxin [Melioribacteraceae bacterium]
MSINNQYAPTYDPIAVQPLRNELTDVGFSEVLTVEDFESVVNQNNDETVFLFINSVCGCSAGTARPGATLALQGEVIPNKLVTAFAGQEKEVIQHIREKYLNEFSPCSPCMAMFRNGKLEFYLPRFEIEKKRAEDIAEILTGLFKERCSNNGPSIPSEDFEKLKYKRMCGSKIEMNNN